jgi:prepilin-type N-terminal cleavage/methylation domain-containing protein
MRMGNKGFTLLEMLIAMGVLATVLATFVVMIGVAGQIMANNRQEVQRAYTKLSVSEVVRSNPDEIMVFDEEDPDAEPIKGFFPGTWGTGSGMRKIDKIIVGGTNILQYSARSDMEWNAEIEHVPGGVNIKIIDEQNP